ncbi:response regulator [Adhaeribacter terreus]|uniref:histidine kinase n=1 Tax=Adhaeribacter terreus TaxID=529703 RepID=A0ABW0E8G6_9BACT
MPETLHILIIDDDDVDRLTIKRSLKTAGISAETTVADSGNAGLAHIKTKSFDCIFIDFKLPDMDGLELLQKIRETDADVPVLLVTSYGDERIATKAIQLGAADYISKTQLTPEGISQSLRSAIRLKKTELEKREALKQLQNTQAELQTIIENIPIIISKVDKDGNFTFSAGKGLSLIGRKTHDVIGKSLFDVYANNPKLLEEVRKAMNGQITRTTNLINGSYFETLFQPIRTNSGEFNGLMSFSFDITDRMKSEETLKKAKELAEETVKVKEEFFANMSHEIRTPMNGIIGLTSVLQKTELTDEQRTYLDAIHTSSEHLLVIINDLLDFSKMEAGKIMLEEINFDLRKLINDTVELLSPKARERNNRLKVIVDPQIPEQVCGDPVRFSQVLTNLIGNAIKFTENGQIRILAENIKETADSILLEFEVQDTGIGIPEDKLQSIFESFTQASSDTTRKFGGTGLGLTISKQLIEMQGGKLSVRSKQGEGSTFTFSINFKNPEAQPLQATAEELEIDPKELGPVRVLLAEDNEINQLLARKVITDWGFELDIAANGRIAVELLKENDYDVVLMDMQMPEMDGYEATKYIRNEMGPKSNVPIIAFTAHATKMEIGKCMLAGANAYVSKPLKPNELLSEIYDLVNQEPGIVFKPDLTEENTTASENIGEVNIDLTFLKEMAAGNQTFMDEIIGMFISATPESLQKMQEAINENDWTNVKAIAHRLKSSMFLIGIKELEMNMATIEQNAQNAEENELVQKLLDRTKKICEAAITKLKQL